MDMREKAIVKFLAGLLIILRSDQGSQYLMRFYCDKLRQAKITQNMSCEEKNSLDNAKVEGPCGHLKAEYLYNKTFDSMELFVA